MHSELKTLEENLNRLSKHQLEIIISKTRNELINRYGKKQRRPKYGNLSKYITQKKFELILRSEKLDKFRFIYYLMRKIALRVGEVPEINLSCIDLDNKTIFIKRTEKSNLPDICYLDDELTQKLKEYIKERQESIIKHQGYLFYPEIESHSKRIKISCNVIRNRFRNACSKSNIQINYGNARTTGYKLNLYTTHSLRHSGITDFYYKTHDIEKTRIYARHLDVNSTMHYIHITEQQMKDAVDGKLNYSKEEINEIILMKKRLNNIESAISKIELKIAET